MAADPIDFTRYIGIPFKDNGRDFSGCDCYGLVYLIYKFEFEVNLPRLDGEYEKVSEHTVVNDLIVRNMDEWAMIDEPRIGDVVLFRSSYISGMGYHIGMITCHNWMIHATKGMLSAFERYSTSKWVNKVLGFYRHRLMI